VILSNSEFLVKLAVTYTIDFKLMKSEI